MASLVSYKYVTSSVNNLCQVDNSNLGFDTTLRNLLDGAGTSCPLQIATNFINIQTCKINGHTVTLGNTLTATSTVDITGAFTIAGAFTTAAAFTQAGAYATTLTSTGVTNATLPAGTVTLVALDSIDTLTNKTLVAPALGTPASGSLTNCTSLPYTSLTGMGSGVSTFLGAPSSANLLASLTTKTGTGNAVFATSPTLITPDLGVATVTSVNKVTITQPATGSTLTIVDGKTVTVNHTLILQGFDGQTIDFRPVYLSRGDGAGTTLPDNTNTKIPLATALYDNQSWWDATNKRFVPLLAGLYVVTAQVSTVATADQALIVCSIYKNGSPVYVGNTRTGGGGSGGSSVSGIVTMNGSTDYLELFGISSAGSTSTIADANKTFMTITRISGTV